MQKNEKINKNLKERYKNDTEYREKKKKIAMEHYYAKKYSSNGPISITKEDITLFF